MRLGDVEIGPGSGLGGEQGGQVLPLGRGQAAGGLDVTGLERHLGSAEVDTAAEVVGA